MTLEEQMARLHRYISKREQCISAVDQMTTKIAAELYRIERDIQSIAGSVMSSKYGEETARGREA